MQKSDMDTRFRVILILWGSLVMGVVFFTAVVWAITTGLVGDWTPTLQPGLVKSLLGAPVLLMVVGIFYRRGEVKAAMDPEEYVQRYQVRILIASAMQEGGGLMGVALCLLSGMPTWALAMGSLAVAAMVLSRPVRSDLDQRTRGL